MNCGSSTLKFQLIEADGGAAAGRQRRLARGIVDGIGGRGVIDFAIEDGESRRRSVAAADHGVATGGVLAWLESVGLLAGLNGVGHRVVHGGDRFLEPTVIDDEVLEAIEALADLAPLHNAPSLEAIRTARAVLGAGVPMVATFDTAFHRTLPERASRYAIPLELADEHRIRRYGFHGPAHRYMTERYAAITATPLEQVKLVTLQLGNGCSATAIEGGRSVDTSMGFTPLEGLMMGTRSGDVDPSLAGFLARREGVDVEEAEAWLNTRSGLLGVAGRSSDMRELLEAEAGGDERAALAVDMFCYRVRKYIGAYLAALGGADAVVFGGGIGENAPLVRARICAGMGWCGLLLDEDRNARTIGSEGRISIDDSRVQAYVIPVDEAAIIARDTARRLRQQG
ncbi:MAG TPA: acetate kinase [Dehalococcoidia bacterium]|nr:acetate kinase [Dehalococcoidia bacterium]